MTLRHGWMTVTDFPTAGLDEFNRKRIRNDAPILALWEARIHDVRVPLEDLSTSDGARRMRDLTARGMRFGVFSAGVPDRTTVDTVRSLGSDIQRWEIIAPPDRFDDVIVSIEGSDLGATHLAIAPIVPVGPSDAAVHHFVAAGFGVRDDPTLDRWNRIDKGGVFDELVFRIPWTDPVGDQLVLAGETAGASGRRAVVIVDLPRGARAQRSMTMKPSPTA